jgi:hypothetical protein
MYRFVLYCACVAIATGILLSPTAVTAQQGFRAARCGPVPCEARQVRRSSGAIATRRGEFALPAPPQGGPVESSYNRCGACGASGG